MEHRRTPLYDFHVDNGARMVPFAGWDMPVQYPAGIKAEHLATRANAGLFDVSHMAQIEIRGDAAVAMLERLTPTDVGAIKPGRVRYSLFLNETGGVLDDLMIARFEDAFHLVVNAGRAEHDIGHLRANLCDDVTMTHHADRALLALQGPAAASVLADLGTTLDGVVFMDIARLELCGVSCVVTRSGYTGEDGFEISLPADAAVAVATKLAAHPAVTLAGLGARDTLRMEAGLPLWGHELDETINPVTGGVPFALSKRRREAADFPGAAAIMQDYTNGPARRLIGVLPEGGRPVRDGTELSLNGNIVGIVSSGGFAPSLDAPAALAIIDSALAQPGTQLIALTRGKETPVTLAALPLVSHNYSRG